MSTVARCIVLLKIIISTREHYSNEPVYVNGKDVEISCGLQSYVQISRDYVLFENLSRTIISRPPAKSVVIWQQRSINSWYLRHNLLLSSAKCSRKWDSLDQATFFKSWIEQFRRLFANHSRLFLFFFDSKGMLGGLLLNSILCKVGLAMRWDMLYNETSLILSVICHYNPFVAADCAWYSPCTHNSLYRKKFFSSTTL